MDLAAEALRQAGAEIGAFEHDGLFIHAPFSAERVKGIAEEASGYPMTAKPTSSCDLRTLVGEVSARAGGTGWDVHEDGWEEAESLVREARVPQLTAHDLFARVVINEPCVSDSVPWPIKDLFKMPQLAQNYVWYDADRHAWVEGGAN
eukprot:2878278-Prorocentrum_lima.AAC.1